MWDETNSLPDWWLDGLIATVDGSIEVPLALTPHPPFPEIERTKLYVDVIEDAQRYFSHGLPPGGLTTLILLNRPFDELRIACHPMVDDDTLRATAQAIWACLGVKFRGSEIKLAVA